METSNLMLYLIELTGMSKDEITTIILFTTILIYTPIFTTYFLGRH